LAYFVEDRTRRLRPEALIVARVLPRPEIGDGGIGGARHDAGAKILVGIDARQIDERWPRALKESGDAVKEPVLKTRPPALATPQVLERGDDAGGGKRKASVLKD